MHTKIIFIGDFHFAGKLCKSVSQHLSALKLGRQQQFIGMGIV